MAEMCDRLNCDKITPNQTKLGLQSVDLKCIFKLKLCKTLYVPRNLAKLKRNRMNKREFYSFM